MSLPTEETDMTTAVHLEAVRKTYEVGGDEVVALDHADLVVEQDEIVALIGPSGSGKTTLCSIAGGLLTATSGSVVVAGQDISGFGSRQLTDFRRTSVGFVFQSVNLVPFLTARENLLVVDELAGRRRTGRRRATARADQLLERARPGRSLEEPPGPAVRRSAPTGRHRPRTDERARPRPVRRAHFGPRLPSRGPGRPSHPG